MKASEVERILALVPKLLELSHKRMWIDYDDGADVLYINFKRPSHADDSELTDEDIIIRYEKGEIIGLTVLHACKRKADKFKFDLECGLSDPKDEISSVELQHQASEWK